MSDERLRDLERRFKESGSPEDEVAWLQERVRSGEELDWDSYSRLAELNVGAAAGYLRARVERGELSQEKLELAAYCGDPGALLAAAEVGRTLAQSTDGLSRFVDGLEAWHGDVLRLAALVLLRISLEACSESSLPFDGRAALRAAISREIGQSDTLPVDYQQWSQRILAEEGILDESDPESPSSGFLRGLHEYYVESADAEDPLNAARGGVDAVGEGSLGALALLKTELAAWALLGCLHGLAERLR